MARYQLPLRLAARLWASADEAHGRASWDRHSRDIWIIFESTSLTFLIRLLRRLGASQLRLVFLFVNFYAYVNICVNNYEVNVIFYELNIISCPDYFASDSLNLKKEACLKKKQNKSTTSNDSDALVTKSDARPIPDVEIGPFVDRLQETIGDESLNSFARRADLSEGMLRHLLKGGFPRLHNLMRIADTGSVDFIWLWTGIGTKHSSAKINEDRPDYSPKIKAPTVDANTLARAIVIVEQRTQQVSLPLGKRAKLIAQVYNVIVERGCIDAERIEELIDLVR